MNEPEIAAGLSKTAKYRYAQRVGNQLFVSGQVPLGTDGELVGANNASSQATQCLRNLELLLSVHNFSITDIRQLVVYVVGEQIQLHEAWLAVANWFSDEVPPATLLGVARLGYDGQLVEVDATVVNS
jgi:enamine deaminase RidA (YjgF/YER057c/UK114 family)